MGAYRRIAVALATLGLCSPAWPASSARLLVKLAPGEVWTYRISMQMDGTVEAQGQQQFTSYMTLLYRMAVQKRLPNGEFLVKVTVGDVKVSTPGQALPFAPTQAISKMLLISPNGRQRALSPTGASGGPLQTDSFGNMAAVVLPARPVAVGDTWSFTQTVPLGPGQSFAIAANTKVVSLTSKAARLRTSLSAPFSIADQASSGIQIRGEMAGDLAQDLLLASGMPSLAGGIITMNVEMAKPQDATPSGAIRYGMTIQAVMRLLSHTSKPTAKPRR